MYVYQQLLPSQSTGPSFTLILYFPVCLFMFFRLCLFVLACILFIIDIFLDTTGKKSLKIQKG